MSAPRYVVLASLFFLGLALAHGSARADIPVLSTDNLHLEVGVMGQLAGTLENVGDPYKNGTAAYLFLQEARLRVTGGYQDYTFNLELALGGEESVVAQPGVSLGLLDLSFNIPLHFLGRSFIKAGQFKVPYGREQLTYEGDLQFVDRSINQPAFLVGRDVGLTLNLRSDHALLIAGAFTGGGRDVPVTNIPEDLGSPLLVARATVGNMDEDPYYLRQNDLANKKVEVAFSVNGLFMRDTLIGHSTVLNVKLADKNLLLNSNWNPYIAKAPFDQGDWFQVGADAALRVPIKTAQFAAELEIDYSNYSNKYGALAVLGGRGQASIEWKHFELAARYAFILPDAGMSYTSAAGVASPITGSAPIHEITPALSYYLRGQNLKVVLDAPILVDVPVFTEKNVGTYVATQLPNEASVLGTGGSVARQTVTEARLMLQARF